MWHYTTYHGKELLIVGHSPRRNDCILVDLAGLPMDQSIELRRIAQSRAGQEVDHLAKLLVKLTAPNKMQNWFEYLCYKMEQRNGPVFTLPLKEIQDAIQEDQRAIFKGYGKGRRNKYLETLNESVEEDSLPDILPEAGQPVNTPMANGRAGSVGVHAPQGDLGYKLDMLMETFVDQNRQTQQLLAKLIGALTEDTSDAAPEVKAPKPVAKRPSRAKKDENVGRVQV